MSDLDLGLDLDLDEEKKLPKILNIKTVAKSRLFNIQQVDLEFSNGNYREFERLKASIRGAVMIAAVDIKKELIYLIREYAVGTERYELGLPKGLVDHGEDVLDAANRELQEEVGLRAKNLTFVSTLTLAPNYMTHSTDLVIATDFTNNKLEGDEPEPLDVVPCLISEIDDLIKTSKITEARSIAGLYLIKNYLNLQA